MTNPGEQLARLATERSRPDLADLDARSTRELVTTISQGDAAVPAAVAAAADAITAAVDVIVERLQHGGRLIYAGAGTAGRLGVLDAAECGVTFGVDAGVVIALVAGGERAMTTAVEGAEDDRAAARADLAAVGVNPHDAIFVITASGRTPYALAAAESARQAGAATIGLSNNVGSELSRLVEVAIEVDTGPEVVAGSTRLKAGTAQKLVLNTVSTATMVRLGKTYGNLMVDVRGTSQKLRLRAQRIVVEATGVSYEEAEKALIAADRNAKTAIVTLLADVDVETARRHLAHTGGHVRTAVRRVDDARSGVLQ